MWYLSTYPCDFTLLNFVDTSDTELRANWIKIEVQHISSRTLQSNQKIATTGRLKHYMSEHYSTSDPSNQVKLQRANSRPDCIPCICLHPWSTLASTQIDQQTITRHTHFNHNVTIHHTNSTNTQPSPCNLHTIQIIHIDFLFKSTTYKFHTNPYPIT